MDGIQCAVLLAWLERFDWEIERRLETGAGYKDALDMVGIERVQQRLYWTQRVHPVHDDEC